MYLIEFKNLNNQDSVLKFNELLSFSEANDNLMQSVERCKLKGSKLKISYKIIDQESKDVIFNSRIVISGDIESIFYVIKSNKSIDAQIKKHVSDVESGVINETKSIIFEDGEYKTKVDKFKKDKEDALALLREQEQKSSEWELEHQEKVNKLKMEKEQIEQALDSKVKEEEFKVKERLNQIELLEMERKKGEELANQKREEEKRNKLKHEKMLLDLEGKKKEAEAELETLKEQTEKAEIERKKERLILEEEQRKSFRDAEVIQNEEELEEVRLKNYTNKPPIESEEIVNDQGVETPEIVEEEHNKFKIFINHASPIIKKGSRLVYVKSKRAIIKYKRNRAKQKALDAQLKKAKLEFIKEIQKEKQQQEKLTLKQEKKNEKEIKSFQRKEEIYIKELTKGKKVFNFPKIMKLVVTLAIIFLYVDFIYNKDQSNFVYLQEKSVHAYYSIIDKLSN